MQDKYHNMADSIVRTNSRSFSDGGIERYVLDYNGKRFTGNSPQSIRSELAEHMRNAFNEPPQIMDLR